MNQDSKKINERSAPIIRACKGCEKDFPQDKLIKIEEDYYCQDCRDENFFNCNRCDDLIPEDDRNYLEDADASYCNACFNLVAFSCYECDGTYHIDNLNNTENGRVCDVCLENYYSCDRCERYVHQDNTVYDEERDETYCLRCNTRRSSRSSQVIRDYGYQPKYELHKQSWENTIYLGIELEVITPNSPSEFAKKFKDYLETLGYEKYLYFKEDGSLSNGFEIISHPFTLQARHSKIEWKKVLDYLKKNGAMSQQTNECGLHVHVSKNDLNLASQGKLKLFFSTNEVSLKKFSTRKKFNYCEVEEYYLAHFKEDMKQECIRQNGRYVAVNLETDKPTIEFRLFNGCLNFDRFLATLQFCEAITIFCKEHSARYCAHLESWTRFTDWARGTGRYSHMIKYLRDSDLCA